MHIRINIPDWGATELAHGALSLVRGGYVDALQRELAAFAPQDWQPYLLASARYGLQLAIEQLGVKRVAVPAYVCPAVLTGIKAAGAEIVAVDCAPLSFRYDAEQLRQSVRNSTVDAILAPNSYGLDQDFAFLPTLGVPVIEDAAYQAGYVLSQKSEVKNQKSLPCGLRGAAGVWSFNFKSLTGVGGGVLWLPKGERRKAKIESQKSKTEFLLFANYAARAVLRHNMPTILGGAAPPVRETENEARAVLQQMKTGAMSELQAVLALTQWRRRAGLQQRQRANSDILAQTIAHCNGLEQVHDTASQMKTHLFPVLVKSENAPESVFRVRKLLHDNGIQTETPYPVLLGERDILPNAHALAERLLLVPCHASLGERQMAYIAATMKKVSCV